MEGKTVLVKNPQVTDTETDMIIVNNDMNCAGGKYHLVCPSRERTSEVVEAVQSLQ